MMAESAPRRLYSSISAILVRAKVDNPLAMAGRIVEEVLPSLGSGRGAGPSELHDLLANKEPSLPERVRSRIVKAVLDLGGGCWQDRLHIPILEFDSFSAASAVEPGAVKDLVPLTLPEKVIKEAFADIIGEPLLPVDWGGERSDLYTTRLKRNGKTIRAAFLLKGRGFRSVLYISELGKRGDQVIRLLTEPADVFIVQHRGRIDPMVTRHLEDSILANQSSAPKRYSLCDGVDTARILCHFEPELFKKPL